MHPPERRRFSLYSPRTWSAIIPYGGYRVRIKICPADVAFSHYIRLRDGCCRRCGSGIKTHAGSRSQYHCCGGGIPGIVRWLTRKFNRLFNIHGHAQSAPRFRSDDSIIHETIGTLERPHRFVRYRSKIDTRHCTIILSAENSGFG